MCLQPLPLIRMNTTHMYFNLFLIYPLVTKDAVIYHLCTQTLHIKKRLPSFTGARCSYSRPLDQRQKCIISVHLIRLRRRSGFIRLFR